MSILEMLTQQLGSGGIQKISRSLGADEGATGSAIGAALPLLMGALARNSATNDGAEQLHRALNRHDGSVLDNVSGFLDQPDENDGNGILGHVLGGRRGTVEAGVSKASGLDQAAVAKLLPMLAPLVMGAVGRTQRQSKADAASLAGVLASERNQIEQEQPALQGLGRLLDTDGDGQVVDDLARMGKGLLGGLFRK